MFHKLDKRSGEWLPATCPEKLSRRLVGVASELGFRPCSGFARTPLFLDGEVIAAPGWNAATGMILDPPLDMPAIPEQPTKADATAALKTLLHPFRGYLNDNQNLECVFAAAAITAALRASLPTAPAIVLDGNTIGAGKGKAARALAVIAVGELPAVIPEGHNDEETEKRIAAAVLQGSPALLLDNLQRTMSSTTLESILTDPITRIRKFGSLSDDVTIECRALVLLTANNASLRRDLLRRTLPVRLVVPHENPERRYFDFDPVDEAKRDRGELLAAAFTIVKAWHLVRGHPEHAPIRDKTLGSFEAWAAVVAGAVEWLTGANPIAVIEDRKDSDTTAQADRGMIGQLAQAFGDGETFTAAEAAAKLQAESWREVVYFKGERPDGRAVGYWLRARKDRHFRIDDETGQLRLAILRNAGVDRKGIVSWRIDVVSPAAENQGVPPNSDGRAGDAGDDSVRTREDCQYTRNGVIHGADIFRDGSTNIPGIPGIPGGPDEPNADPDGRVRGVL